MTRDLPSALTWMGTGTKAVMTVVATLEPHDFDAASQLPDWDRRTVIAHLARNAGALGRLLRWARTGVETPMYSSPQQRVDEIADSARQSPTLLLDDLRAAIARLNMAVNEVPQDRWSYSVRSALGRTITATEVPWLRARELWLHAVDLRKGVSVNDFPSDFAVALIDDVLTTRRARGELADITVAIDGRTWSAPETEANQVTGNPTELAGWLTNRLNPSTARDVELPTLGPWI